MKLAEQMRERSREAIKIIEKDSEVATKQFVQGDLAKVIEKWADKGTRSIVIPDDLKGYKPRVGEITSDPAVGTYLTYSFENNDNFEILLFRHLKKELEAEGFTISWNEVSVPYLRISW